MKPPFRVKFTDPNGIWLTARIDSYIDAATLVRSQLERGFVADVFVSDAIWDAEWTDRLRNIPAMQEQLGIPQVGTVSWGCPCEGCQQKYPIRTAAMVRVGPDVVTHPPEAIFALPDGTPAIVGGFPLLDVEPAEDLEQKKTKKTKHAHSPSLPSFPSVSSPAFAAVPPRSVLAMPQLAPLPPGWPGPKPQPTCWHKLPVVSAWLLDRLEDCALWFLGIREGEYIE